MCVRPLSALHHLNPPQTYRGEDPQTNSTHRWNLLGDTRGWLFRSQTSLSSRLRSFDEPSRLDSDMDMDMDINWLPWSAELNLQPNGTVSSISMWGSRWMCALFILWGV